MDTNDAIRIDRIIAGRIMALAASLAVLSLFFLWSTPFTAPVVFVLLLFVWAAYYTFVSKEHLSEMCCMMSGMFFGMMPGFFIGAMIGLVTTDFLIGMIVGTLSGVLFGIPLGRFGGPLGRMEGVMAAPMGGIMGAMTGVMVRFYNVSLFMPFFTIVVVFTVWEMVNLVRTHDATAFTSRFVAIGIIISLLALGASFANNYTAEVSGLAFAQGIPTAPSAPSPTPAAGVQDVTIKVGPTEYTPDYVVVKKNIPVRLTLEAEPYAGCTRSFVLPAFNVRKTVPQNGRASVEFTPNKAGTFPFSCSMGMATGTLVVQ